MTNRPPALLRVLDELEAGRDERAVFHLTGDFRDRSLTVFSLLLADDSGIGRAAVLVAGGGKAVGTLKCARMRWRIGLWQRRLRDPTIMTVNSKGVDELDAALDLLADSDESAAAEPSPAGPPALPRPASVVAARGSTRRIRFDDLFAGESSPLPAGRGGPEQKIEYLREKLRRAEEQIGRFREAWEIREQEMDAFETATAQAQQETARAQSDLAKANEKLRGLDEFIRQKKREFDSYGQKVAGAFEEKEQELAALRAQLDEARGVAASDQDGLAAELERVAAELDEQKRLAKEERDVLEYEVALRDEAIAKLRQTIQQQRQSIEEQRRDEESWDEAQEGLRREAEEQCRALERDIATREVAIAGLKEALARHEEQIESLQEALDDERELSFLLRANADGQLADREAASVGLQAELAELRRAAAAAELQLADAKAQEARAISRLAETEATLKGEIAGRDERIISLSAELEAHRDLLAKQGGSSASLEAEMAVQREILEERERRLAGMRAALEDSRAQAARLEEQLAGAELALARAEDAAARPTLATADAGGAHLAALAHGVETIQAGLRALDKTHAALRQAGVLDARQRKAVRLSVRSMVSGLTKVKEASGLAADEED